MSISENITPEDSVVPIYRETMTPEEEFVRSEVYAVFLASEEAVQAQEEARKSALIKLSALGLTEEEARAVIGL